MSLTDHEVTSTERTRQMQTTGSVNRLSATLHDDSPAANDNAASTSKATETQPNADTSLRRLSPRRLLILAAGRLGEGMTSLAALGITAVIFHITDLSLLLLAAMLLLAYRALYAVTRGPERVLPAVHVRRSWTRVLADELKGSVAIMAVQYFAPLPVDRGVVTFFLLAQFISQFIHFLLTPYLLRRSARQPISLTTRRVLILGTGEKARQFADRLIDTPDMDAAIVGFVGGGAPRLWRYRDIPLLSEQRDIDLVLTAQPLDAVLFAASPSEYESLQPLLERIELHGTPVFLSPELPSPRRGSVRPVWIADEAALLSRMTPSDRLTLFLKGIVDRTVAAILLCLLAPVFVATALAISLESRGGIFFQQLRVGRYGRLFPMYKFRSMRSDAEALKATLSAQNEMQGPAFKMKADPRITRVGRFIRKYSIDELPQLLNILLGDMSLVGPRPALPKEVAQYADWQRRRLTVRPGLTCIWQVSGRNSIPFEQWMSLDLQYIDRWSLKLDAELLLRTIPTVIKGTGV